MLNKSSLKVIFTRCQNPLCNRAIFEDSHLFGVGKFCDEFCKSEYVSMKNTLKKKAKIRIELSTEELGFIN